MLSLDDNNFIDNDSENFDPELLKSLTLQSAYVFLIFKQNRDIGLGEILDSDVVRNIFPYIKQFLKDVREVFPNILPEDMLLLVSELGFCLYVLTEEITTMPLGSNLIQCHFQLLLDKNDQADEVIKGTSSEEVEHRIFIEINRSNEPLNAIIEIGFTKEYVQEKILNLKDPINPAIIVLKILKDRLTEKGTSAITLEELVSEAQKLLQIEEKDNYIKGIATLLVRMGLLILTVRNNQLVYTLNTASLN
jgi:hypothetical protein